MFRQLDFVKGYRITRMGPELVIEVTDYHARPLRLTSDDLAVLGIELSDRPGPRERPPGTRRDREHEAQ